MLFIVSLVRSLRLRVFLRSFFLYRSSMLPLAAVVPAPPESTSATWFIIFITQLTNEASAIRPRGRLLITSPGPTLSASCPDEFYEEIFLAKLGGAI